MEIVSFRKKLNVCIHKVICIIPIHNFILFTNSDLMKKMMFILTHLRNDLSVPTSKQLNKAIGFKSCSFSAWSLAVFPYLLGD